MKFMWYRFNILPDVIRVYVTLFSCTLQNVGVLKCTPWVLSYMDTKNEKYKFHHEVLK